MASLLKLYVDTQSNKLMASPKGGRFTVPDLYQGNVMPVELYLYEPNPTGGQTNPYAVITEEQTVKLALVTPDADGSPTIHASLTFSSFNSATGSYTGNFSLNTAEINTLIGSADSVTTTFEIQIQGGGLYATEYRQSIVVNAKGLASGSPVVVGSETYPTDDQANAKFAKKVGDAGESIILKDSTGTYGVILYVDSNGEFKADKLTI